MVESQGVLKIFSQSPPGAVQYHPRCCFQEETVSLSHLVCMKQEDAAELFQNCMRGLESLFRFLRLGKFTLQRLLEFLLVELPAMKKKIR